jgi:uncharacterized YigZ family protein
MRYVKASLPISIEIEKSTFIGLLFPVSSLQDIQEVIQTLKTEHPKANHFCYAAIYGEDGQYANSSDDGEPSRTAGIPIFEVLKHHDVTNVLCVVIRYFGGIKLGAGGLVRAYTKAAAESLKHAKFYIKKTVPTYEISFAYAMMGPIDRYLEEKATILEKIYLENVTYRLYILDDSNVMDEIHHLCIHINHLPPITIDINL